MAITDSEFLLAFERCEIPSAEFRHLDHLRVAYLYLRDDPTNAVEKITAGIRRFAAHHGASHIYHETLTRAWIAIVAAAIAATPNSRCFSDFLAKRVELRDKDLLARFYSREVLFSNEARSAFIAPDLTEIPFRLCR